jgi:hypothetical protein
LTLIKSILEAQLAEQRQIAADWKTAAQTREAANAELINQIKETHPALLDMGREVKMILAALAVANADRG